MAERRSSRLVAAVGAALAAVVVAGLFVDMHPHFPFESWPGFFALLALGGCAVIVGVAALVGRFLDRPMEPRDGD